MKYFKRVGIIIAILGAIIIAQYVYSFFYWRIISPQQVIGFRGKADNKLNKLSSEQLIRKITVFDLFSPYPEWAITILAERKEKKAVPLFIKFVEAKDHRFRGSAIGALGLIGDKRAIPILWKIVEGNPVDINYSKIETPEGIDALEALASLKDERAYNIAIDLATLKNDPNDFRAYGIRMLENFGSFEDIPLLEKIANYDPEHYMRGNAKRAIDHIKSIQKEQEQQNKEKSPPTPIN